MDYIHKKTSMQDIATALGISKNAVSLALNNKSGISKSLRAKVFQIAIAMNYGGYGKLGGAFNSKLIAICLPSAISETSQFYSSVYWSIERNLATRGYRSMITSITKQMEDGLILPSVLMDGDVKAVVLVGILPKAYVKAIKNKIDKVILVDNYFLDLPINSVVTANIEGGNVAASYLLSLGHKKLGFAGNIHQYSAYRDRFTGFTMALSNAGLQLKDAWCYTDAKFYKPYVQIDKIVDLIIENSVEAVCCANDRIAIQLIGRLQSKSVRIPEDLSIIGFDDIENADIIHPPLTTMQVPRAEMGRRAAELLVYQLEHEDNNIPSSIVIYPKLIERKSTKSRR